MKHQPSILALTLSLLLLSFIPGKDSEWISLFDGKSLDGWKVGDNASSFSVRDGAIVVNGDVAHLYYDGLVGKHDFKNFEFRIDVTTLPGSNSGIYFHTEYQQGSWPKKGYEVQVNNSHTDWRRTGSLWAIQDVKETYVRDEEWFTMRIAVKDKNIKVYINDKLINDYTEPENAQRSESMKQRLVTNGTFALQGHDPKSTVMYKNIQVRLLP